MDTRCARERGLRQANARPQLQRGSQLSARSGICCASGNSMMSGRGSRDAVLEREAGKRTGAGYQSGSVARGQVDKKTTPVDTRCASDRAVGPGQPWFAVLRGPDIPVHEAFSCGSANPPVWQRQVCATDHAASARWNVCKWSASGCLVNGPTGVLPHPRRTSSGGNEARQPANEAITLDRSHSPP